jgi:hypothetical protein
LYNRRASIVEIDSALMDADNLPTDSEGDEFVRARPGGVDPRQDQPPQTDAREGAGAEADPDDPLDRLRAEWRRLDREQQERRWRRWPWRWLARWRGGRGGGRS